MNRKQIIIILCTMLALCAVAIGVQAHSAKSQNYTDAPSAVSQTQTTAEAGEESAPERDDTAAESTAAEQETTASNVQTTAKGQGTAEAQTTSKGRGTTAAQTTTRPEQTTTAKPTDAPSKKITVTFSVTCHNAVRYGSEKAPASGVIIAPVSYTAEEGATVFDVLKAVSGSKGVSLNYDRPTYIKGIGGLNEKECGAGSGWMYRVNGTAPMTACNKYTLKSGDVVEWYYVTNSSDN